MIPTLADLMKIWAEGTKYYDIKNPKCDFPTLRCKYCYTFLGFIYSDYVDLDLDPSAKIKAADPEFFEKINTHLNSRYRCTHVGPHVSN